MVQSATQGVGRRQVWRIAAAGATLSTVPRLAAAATPSETAAAIIPQPRPAFTGDPNTSDIIVETLIALGRDPRLRHRRRRHQSDHRGAAKAAGRIRYIGVRHEEAAAFMASGWAKHTGRLGVCVGTTGPGAIHLINGLYDAHIRGAPVVALTGLTFHDLSGRPLPAGRRHRRS